MGRSIRYGTREGNTLFCLGHIPHAAQADEVVCHSCGALVAGAQFGIYQIQHLLGQGRNGNAYLATHSRSRQQVVLKLLPPDHCNMGLWEDARREIRTVTALRHPSILPVYSCTSWYPEQPGGFNRPFPELMRTPTSYGEHLLAICQYAPGTLARFISHYEQSEQKSISNSTLLSRLLRLIQQIGTALHTAHTHNIVHGALLPSNMLLDGHDHLWIADFGLARLRPPASPYLPPELYAVSTACIQQGNMLAYWEAVNPASDQYMLGMLCQQLLTRLLRTVDYEPALPVLQCATSQKPARRFANVEIFMHELVSQMTRKRTLPLNTSMPSGIWEQPRQEQAWHGQKRLEPQGTYPPVSQAENERYNRMADYQLAVSVQPPSAEEWEKRGDKLFSRHDYDGAARAYQRALEIDSEKASIWLALGDAYLALENKHEALKAYEQAMTLNPNDPLAWSNRGTALDALGRHKEAMDCYERAEQLR